MMALLSCSCVYMADRGRDFTDIMTLSAETGLVNADVQVGVFNLGLGLSGGHGYGLRSGAMGAYQTADANLLFLSGRYFEPGSFAQARGKGYEYSILYIEGGENEDPPVVEIEEGGIFNLFQVEATVTLGVGLRIGVNFAEMADFILGFFQVDILKDDQAAVKARESEFQRQLETLERLKNHPQPETTFLKPAVDITDENQL